MSGDKPTDKSDLACPKGEVLVYQTEDGQVKVDVRLEDETVRLTQAQIADLFQVKPQNITMHLKNIFAEGELDELATCKECLQIHRVSYSLANEED